MKESRYPLFDYIRLALALLVVSGHVFGWQVFPAVPGFLALSGFLVLQSYNGSTSWQAFAWKRIVRVYPALLSMLCVAVAIVGLKATGAIGLYYLSFGFSHSSMDDALWSLPFEEALYAGLVLLMFAGAYKAKWPIWSMAVVGAAFCLWGFLGHVPMQAALPRALPLVWCFAVGNLGYLYRDRLAPFRMLAFPLLVAGGLLMTWGIVHRLNMPFYALAAMPAAPGVVLIGTQFLPALPRIPDFSYSCYIWHLLLLHVVGKGWLFPAMAVACACSWYLIEKPIGRKYKNRPPRLHFWKTRRAEILEAVA